MISVISLITTPLSSLFRNKKPLWNDSYHVQKVFNNVLSDKPQEYPIIKLEIFHYLYNQYVL
jgi:hypothetical protein